MYRCVWCTLQHAVVGLPVFPFQRLPEARRLRPLIALMYGHLAAAVEPRLQRTPERERGETELMCNTPHPPPGGANVNQDILKLTGL